MNEARESMKTHATVMLKKTESLIWFLTHPTINEDVNKVHIAYLRGVANALSSIVRYEDSQDGSLSE